MISLVEPLNLEHKGLKRLVLISQLLGKLLDGSDVADFCKIFRSLSLRGHRLTAFRDVIIFTPVIRFGQIALNTNVWFLSHKRAR